MSGWLVARQNLTTEQVRAVELSSDQNRIISGGPGSGKTLVLLHRARELIDKGSVAEGRYFIFVYTKALSQYIRAALDDLGIPQAAARNYDSWCVDLYKRHVSQRLPWDTETKSVDIERVRREVLEKVRSNPGNFHLLDFVLVDEGQDLTATVFETLKIVSAHVTVALDQKQRIYEVGAAEPQVCMTLGIRSRSVALLETYRCCPYISKLAGRFLLDPAERRAFDRQTRTEQGEKERPLLYRAAGHEDEKVRLAAIARARLARGERVAILLPSRRLVYGLAEGLHEMGIPVEVPRRRGGNPGDLLELDFASDLIKVMPYHSAKGLTFDSVLLPRLNSCEFRQVDPGTLLRLLFVGITRATIWVYLSAWAGQELGLLAQLGLLRTMDDLIVQDAGDADRTPAPAGLPATPPAEDEDGLTDWL